MKKLILILYSSLALSLSGCTITISQSLAETEGNNDSIAEDQDATSSTDASPDISVPIKAL